MTIYEECLTKFKVNVNRYTYHGEVTEDLTAADLIEAAEDDKENVQVVETLKTCDYEEATEFFTKNNFHLIDTDKDGIEFEYSEILTYGFEKGNFRKKAKYEESDWSNVYEMCDAFDSHTAHGMNKINIANPEAPAFPIHYELGSSSDYEHAVNCFTLLDFESSSEKIPGDDPEWYLYAEYDVTDEPVDEEGNLIDEEAGYNDLVEDIVYQAAFWGIPKEWIRFPYGDHLDEEDE